MAFLAPLFIIGIAALAVPILVHLVHKERKETTPFPSLMFLLRTPYQHSRRLRIRDWLLFLTRALVFLLLVAAFARPVFDRPPDAAAAAVSGGREQAYDPLVAREKAGHPARGRRVDVGQRNSQ